MSYRTLIEDVDRRFAEIAERQRARVQCRAGCSACCRARLHVTRLEEHHLREGLATLPDDVRAEFARRASDPEREFCPALDDEGLCQVREWRPVACRSYGVPLRHRYPVPLVNPAKVDVCDLNFVGVDTAALPDEDVLDQTALNEALEALDDAHCREHGLPLGERVSLASVLSGQLAGE